MTPGRIRTRIFGTHGIRESNPAAAGFGDQLRTMRSQPGTRPAHPDVTRAYGKGVTRAGLVLARLPHVGTAPGPSPGDVRLLA